MKITKNTIVSMDYTLTDAEGNVIDTSVGRTPLQYMQGSGQIIPGLEKEMEGKDVGDSFKVEVKPEEGYGLPDERMIQLVPRENFGDQEVKVGDKFQVMTGHGALIVTVVEVLEDQIKVDGNHELAGKTLFFDVTVKEVREATADEIEAMNHHSCGGDCCGCHGCGDEGCHDDDEECGCGCDHHHHD